MLLVDGDVVAYRCAAVAEKTEYAVTYGHTEAVSYYADHKSAKAHADEVDGYIWNRKVLQPVEFALNAAKTVLIDFIERWADHDEMKIFLSGERNFRDKIWHTKKYKGNRDAVSRPTHLAAVRQYLASKWGAVTTDGYEADDALGAELYATGGRGIVVSNDKDLDQLAGWHFNWTTGELYRISQRDADCFLYQQILSGDSTDNVPGIEGLGPAKASKCLAGAKSTRDLFERVQSVYRDRHGKDADAYLREQADLIYIWRKYGDRLEFPQ